MKLAIALTIFAAFIFGVIMLFPQWVADHPSLTWFEHHKTSADYAREQAEADYAVRDRVFAEEKARRDFWLRELGK